MEGNFKSKLLRKVKGNLIKEGKGVPSPFNKVADVLDGSKVDFMNYQYDKLGECLFVHTDDVYEVYDFLKQSLPKGFKPQIIHCGGKGSDFVVVSDSNSDQEFIDSLHSSGELYESLKIHVKPNRRGNRRLNEASKPMTAEEARKHFQKLKDKIADQISFELVDSLKKGELEKYIEVIDDDQGGIIIDPEGFTLWVHETLIDVTKAYFGSIPGFIYDAEGDHFNTSYKVTNEGDAITVYPDIDWDNPLTNKL